MYYIFVHGLSGWGSYDKIYRRVPYWGMFGGDLMKYLRKQGLPSYAASVSPEGSAWDRACELYAQLTGTVVDYGKAHSERCGHKRFGRDFSRQPLIPNWQNGERIVLLGHSFGGTTVRLFSELLANGSAEERAITDEQDLSPLFRGGQGDRLHAIVTLAAPTNGTTAYDLNDDPNFDPNSIKLSLWDRFWGNFFSNRKTADPDGRAKEDYAAYDMHIDQALALNDRISTLPWTYYFAVPCTTTRAGEDGVHLPIRSIMEPMFCRSSLRMGRYMGSTVGGLLIGPEWRENDGLVNTVSAMAPMDAPGIAYDPDRVRPGIWQLMPTYHGDHISLQGGIIKINNIRPFYLKLLKIINSLADKEM